MPRLFYLQNRSACWAGVSLAIIAGLFVSAALPGDGDVRLAWLEGLFCAAGTFAGGMLYGLCPAASSVQRYLLAYGAGLMLAAVPFSLLLPALATAAPSYGGVMVGLALGATSLLCLDWLAARAWAAKSVRARNAQPMYLIALVVTLHNLPEGLAIGFAVVQQADQTPLVWGIALQNVPEGWLVAFALVRAGLSRSVAISGAMLSGVVEPLAAIGAAWMAVGSLATAVGLALAAGAMLAAVLLLVMPELRWEQPAHRRLLAGALCAGFVTLSLLDVSFG